MSGQLLHAVDGARAELAALRTQLRAPLIAPVLATLTILCERRAHEPGRRIGVEMQASGVIWLATTLGAEHWLHVGETHDMRIQPHHCVRNFRWFLSGDPSLVVTDFRVGAETAIAGQGGQKFGDAQLTCELGNLLRVTIERRRVPS